MSETKKHRHLIALPVALFALALLSGMQRALPSHARLVESTQNQIVISTDVPHAFTVGPMSVVLDPYSIVHVDTEGTLLLNKGSMIVASRSLLSVDGVRGHDGAAWILNEGDALTAVPLRSPLVLEAGENRMLIPVGSQGVRTGSAMKRLPLPRSSLEDAMKKIPNTVDSSVFRTDESMTLLSALRDISDPWVKAERVPALLSTLFSSAQVLDTAAALPLHVLESLVPLPPAAIDRWADGCLALAAIDGASAVSVLSTASQLPLLFQERGFPKQERAWTKAIDRVSRIVLTILTPAERTALEDVLRVNRGFVSAESIGAIEQPRTEQAVARLVPSALVEAGMQLIAEYDLLLSASTRIDIDSHDTSLVRIEGVFREEQGRDTRYDFSFDPVTALVSSVLREGVLLPNVVTAEVLFR